MLAIAATPGLEEPVFMELAPPPEPPPGKVVCRTLQLGICGTDREILESRRPMTPPGDEFLVLGHECLARVEAVGSGADGVAAGDLVIPLVRRGQAGSAMRADMLAMGQYTERGIVREHGFAQPLWLDEPQYLLPVPPELREVAVFTEPLSVAEKAINEALLLQQARLGSATWTDAPPRVLVTGLGPIGFSGVLAAVCRGWPVTVYGRDDEATFRAEMVRAFGAEYRPEHHFERRLGDVERDGFDLILECTGHDGVLLRVSEALAARGVMVWLGSSQSPRPREHNVSRLMRTALLRNHLHLGSVNAAPRDFRDAARHLDQLRRTHASELSALITDRVSPSEALWHYRQRRPQGIKTVVEYA
ncbi:MAG: alcohol dehydrogenase catalytic domain-containing protein [Pirellulaceae bacterium]|nr:alcohol dehydrogenase catalytic domain-containing protein [Pirellulaceae bacterium]